MARKLLKNLIGSAAVATLACWSSVVHANLQLLAAPEVDLRDCDYSGANHSKQVSSSDLIQQCHDAVLARASGAANRWSTDHSLHVFGHHGMLFIDHIQSGAGSAPSITYKVIAGQNVVFRNVDAVAIDEARKEIFILDSSSRTISVYRVGDEGDVYPRRKIASKDLADAVSIAIDEKAGELLVLNSRSSVLAVFGSMASSDGRRTENSTELKRKVDLSALTASGSLLTDVAASSTRPEIFVFDQGLGKIVSFDKGSGRPAVKTTFGVSGVVDGAQYIQYSAKEDAIRAMRSDGSGHEYSIGSSGSH